MDTRDPELIFDILKHLAPPTATPMPSIRRSHVHRRCVTPRGRATCNPRGAPAIPPDPAQPPPPRRGGWRPRAGGPARRGAGARARSPSDTEHAPDVICPKCGYVQRDVWEINFGPGLDGDAETDCGMCGEVLFVTRYVAVTYTTKVRE